MRILHLRLPAHSRAIHSTGFRFTPRSTVPRPVTPRIQRIASAANQPLEPASYLGPIAFGILTCTGIFVTAAVIYDRNQVNFWQRFSRHRERWRWRWGNEELTLAEMWRIRKDMLLKQKQQWMEHMHDRVQQWQVVPEPVRRIYLMVVDQVASMSEAEITMAALVGINVAVFGCWQIPRLQPFMMRWFTHHPASGRYITLLTSCFSHQEPLHLAMNMIGLWSFGSILHNELGREQFLAAYTATGVGANVASHVLGLATRRVRPLLPSLGASGAIYGVLAGTAYLYPQASVSLIFLPFFPIQLGYALPALMGFDLAGILLRWRMFDHYAHLAGAGIGLAYLNSGRQEIWYPLVSKVHEYRSQK